MGGTEGGGDGLPEDGVDPLLLGEGGVDGWMEVAWLFGK